VRTYRRTVAAIAGPGIAEARRVYTGVPSDVVRVAALVEISAAAAALARTVVKLRHLDRPIAPGQASLFASTGEQGWAA
jgi:hypothetical protein